MKNQKFRSILALLAVFLVVAAVFIFYHGNYLFNVMCLVCCYFVAVTGLNFITGMTGQPMLGMAGVFAIGSYTTSILTTRTGMNPWQAIPFVLLAGLVIGILLGYPSLRLSGVYLSFTTIGFSEIVRILAMNMTEVTGGGTGIKNIPNYVIGSMELSSSKEKLFVYIPIALLVGLFANWIVHSRWGRNFFAIRDNIEAVPICSINVTSVKMVAFCLATMLGCLAGSMYAHMYNYINPSTYNQTLSISIISMLIIGGMGSVWGGLVGSLLVTVLPECLRFFGRYYDFVYAVLMLLMIIFFPGGLVNIFKKENDRKKSLKDLVQIFIGGGK